MIKSDDNNLAIATVSAAELTPQYIELWSRLQRSNPTFASPFFRPEYTQIVASVRPDVEIAILRQDGETVGFLPFHRSAANVGYPIGITKSDFQGVILRQDVAFSAEQLIRGCGLAAWHFNHLIADQEPFCPFHQLLTQSPYIDITNGFEEYKALKRQSGSNLIKQNGRLARGMERDLGPIRVEMCSTDRAVFETMIRWKREHYRRAKSVDHLSAPWQRALLERVWKHESDGLRGVLSVLFVGNKVVAIDLGIQAGAVLHSWCGSYDRQVGSHSPGNILLMNEIKSAASLGINRIDLGKGDEPYKQRFLTGKSFVAEGSVDFRLLAGPLRRARTYARELVRVSPLRTPVQTLVRSFRSWTAYH